MPTAFASVPPADHGAVGADDEIEPMLDFIRAASGGRLLNMHLQMACSPLVLDQYTALRRAIGIHATLDPLPRAAVAVASSAAGQGEYTLAVIGMLARRAGWTDEQVAAITDGRSSGDSEIDALLEVVREAAAGDGTVSDITWNAAAAPGWTTTDLARRTGPSHSCPTVTGSTATRELSSTWRSPPPPADSSPRRTLSAQHGWTSPE